MTRKDGVLEENKETQLIRLIVDYLYEVDIELQSDENNAKRHKGRYSSLAEMHYSAKAKIIIRKLKEDYGPEFIFDLTERLFGGQK